MADDSIYEHYRKFYSDIRKRNYDAAIKEVVPPDVYAEHLANKYSRREPDVNSGLSPSAQAASVRELIIHCVFSGEVEQAVILLEQSFNFGRYRAPLMVRVRVGNLPEYLGKMDAQKVELLRDILNSSAFTIPEKVDWAIFLSKIDQTSPRGIEEADYFLNKIAPFNLDFEIYLRMFRDDMTSWQK